MISSLNKILAKVLDWAIAIVHASMVVILFAGVITRYLFNAPLFWGEELTILGLIWITFLGGVVLVRQDKNVVISIFTDMLPRPVMGKLNVVNSFLAILCLVVMIWQSWKLSGRLSLSTTPALRMSESWYAYALLVGFVLMLYYEVQRFFALVRGKTPSFPEGAQYEERSEL